MNKKKELNVIKKFFKKQKEKKHQKIKAEVDELLKNAINKNKE